MRIPRLYVDDEIHAGQTLQLSAEASHYLIQVLRLKQGDKVSPFNPINGEFLAAIENPSRKQASLKIIEQTKAEEAQGLQISLGLGLSRGDRFDFAIQKATELGVSVVTPLFTEFSEVKFASSERREKKLSHWQKIAISAAEQSGRLSVPKILSPLQLEQWTAEADEELRILLSPRASVGFSSLGKANRCAVLIGPEGGFSEKEDLAAEQSGFIAVKLGERILRTETAPLAALAILQFMMGDLG